MKQKFLLLKNDDNSELLIKEYSELESGYYTLICEETYEMEKLKSVITDKELFSEVIRTNNLYPTSHLMNKLYNDLPDFINSDDKESIEILFEDMEMINYKEKQEAVVEEPAEPVAVDTLLEVGEDSVDEKPADPIDTSKEQTSVADSAAAPADKDEKD